MFYLEEKLGSQIAKELELSRQTVIQALCATPYRAVVSERQEIDSVLKKRISGPHREEETSMVWPNICDDKQGLAKYLGSLKRKVANGIASPSSRDFLK